MNDTIQLTPQMMAIVPIVAYFLQVIKGFPFAEKIKPYLPVVSMLTGIGICYLMAIANPVIAGLLVGISASAGYDIFKKKETK